MTSGLKSAGVERQGGAASVSLLDPALLEGADYDELVSQLHVLLVVCTLLTDRFMSSSWHNFIQLTEAQ